MARKKSGEKEFFWRDGVRRQADSDLSIKQFCAQQQISKASFYAWRRRLKGGTRVAVRSQTARGGSSTEGTRSNSDFIPLKLLDSPAAWELLHPLGYRVRVSGQINAAALQCILGVLDGRIQG